MSDFVFTLKAGVIFLFVLFFAAGGLTLTIGPSQNLLLDLICWALSLPAVLYGATRLAVLLRRRRFADEPPLDPPSTQDLLMYSSMFLFGPLLLAMFAKKALHEHGGFEVGASLVGMFMILSPIAVFRRYVTKR